MIQSIIDVQKSIEQLNELDDAINLSKIDINEMIERAVVQFTFISIQMNKCGENPSMQTVENPRGISGKGIDSSSRQWKISVEYLKNV